MPFHPVRIQRFLIHAPMHTMDRADIPWPEQFKGWLRASLQGAWRRSLPELGSDTRTTGLVQECTFFRKGPKAIGKVPLLPQVLSPDSPVVFRVVHSRTLQPKITVVLDRLAPIQSFLICISTNSG